MNKLTWDIEYRLDSFDNDCDYVDNLSSLSKAKSTVLQLKKTYGNRLVSLDIKGFDKDCILKEHHCII